jgi:hypothetical protein
MPGRDWVCADRLAPCKQQPITIVAYLRLWPFRLAMTNPCRPRAHGGRAIVSLPRLSGVPEADQRGTVPSSSLTCIGANRNQWYKFTVAAVTRRSRARMIPLFSLPIPPLPEPEPDKGPPLPEDPPPAPMPNPGGPPMPTPLVAHKRRASPGRRSRGVTSRPDVRGSDPSDPPIPPGAPPDFPDPDKPPPIEEPPRPIPVPPAESPPPLVARNTSPSLKVVSRLGPAAWRRGRALAPVLRRASRAAPPLASSMGAETPRHGRELPNAVSHSRRSGRCAGCR